MTLGVMILLQKQSMLWEYFSGTSFVGLILHCNGYQKKKKKTKLKVCVQFSSFNHIQHLSSVSSLHGLHQIIILEIVILTLTYN